jgi:hypothetical protein
MIIWLLVLLLLLVSIYVFYRMTISNKSKKIEKDKHHYIIKI